MTRTRLDRIRRRRAVRNASQVAMRLVPASGDVAALVNAVARSRGRVIRVLPCDLATDEPSGLWVPTADVDYVFHSVGIPAEHRRVVICHELAHMLLDHAPQDGLLNTSLVAPSVSPAVAARFFTRHGYADEFETEAEALATHLATELDRRETTNRMMESRDNVSERLR